MSPSRLLLLIISISSSTRRERETTHTKADLFPLILFESRIQRFIVAEKSFFYRFVVLFCLEIFDPISGVIDLGMQQGDQSVLSLRPGGGRGNRIFGSSSSSSSISFGSLSSSDLPLLRPHGGAPASSFPFKVPSFF